MQTREFARYMRFQSQLVVSVGSPIYPRCLMEVAHDSLISSQCLVIDPDTVLAQTLE